MQTIVLAATIRETYAWARAQGRGLRSVRHIANAAALSGRNYDKIVELPSFKKRRDRYAILAGVRQLKRRLPKIQHELDEDWVMPDPPKRVPPANLSPTLFLFANAPVEAPLADVWAAAVKQEAEEDYSIPDEGSESVAEDDTGELFDDGPKAELDAITEEVGKVSDDLSTLADGIQTDTDAETVTATSEVSDPVTSAAARPKRKGRRTNEQKAFDEAFQAYGEAPTEENSKALTEARIALRKRHPDDERLAGNLPDLDF